MTVKRRVRRQRSGHCESGARGGHGRCPYVMGATLCCGCDCHTTTTEDKP